MNKVIKFVLGAFANFRKATISLIMFVLPSVLPHGKNRYPLDVLYGNLKFDVF